MKNGKREATAGGIGVAVAVLIGYALQLLTKQDTPAEVLTAIGAVLMWMSHRVERWLP